VTENILVAKVIFNIVISDRKYLVAKSNTLGTELVTKISVVV